MTIAYSLAASSANKPGHVSRRRKKKINLYTMSFATGAVTSATPTQKHTRSVTASLINAACACSRLTGARWSRCQWASGAPPGEKLAPSYQNLSKQNEWQAAWDVRPHHHHCFFSIFLNWHATLKCRLEITVIVYMTPPPQEDFNQQN